MKGNSESTYSYQAKDSKSRRWIFLSVSPLDPQQDLLLSCKCLGFNCLKIVTGEKKLGKKGKKKEAENPCTLFSENHWGAPSIFDFPPSFHPAWVVVQLLSHVRLFATPWTAAWQTSLSFTVSRSLLKLMSIESVMDPAWESSHLQGWQMADGKLPEKRLQILSLSLAPTLQPCFISPFWCKITLSYSSPPSSWSNYALRMRGQRKWMLSPAFQAALL